MNTPSSRPHNPLLAAILSLLVPGAGQFYICERSRGIALFVTTLACGVLIFWAQDNFRVAVGGNMAIALWVVLGCFAVWNIFDAYRHARGQRSNNLIGLLLPTLIIYIIA